MPHYAANDSYGGNRYRGLPFKPLLSGSRKREQEAQ